MQITELSMHIEPEKDPVASLYPKKPHLPRPPKTWDVQNERSCLLHRRNSATRKQNAALVLFERGWSDGGPACLLKKKIKLSVGTIVMMLEDIRVPVAF